MFELLVAFKYLIPKKKQLSITLIAFMSVGVISLVVWLVLVFISVTEGIEKNWLKKLTDLNAPLQVTPTEHYYSSYYYHIDSISESSNYRSKTFEEKLLASQSDPYNSEEDVEVPPHWPEKDKNASGELKDPIQILFSSLNTLKNKGIISAFQDFEMSGALLKLQLLRTKAPLFSPRSHDAIHFLSQVSYLCSFPSKNPYLYSLVLPPSSKDVNHLLFLSTHELGNARAEESPSIQKISSSEFASRILPVLTHMNSLQLKTSYPMWKIPHHLFPNDVEFKALAQMRGHDIYQIILDSSPSPSNQTTSLKGTIKKSHGQFFFLSEKAAIPVLSSIPILSKEILQFSAALSNQNIFEIDNGRDLRLEVITHLQGHALRGIIPWEGLEVHDSRTTTTFTQMPKVSPFWMYQVQAKEKSSEGFLPKSPSNEFGVLLPKNFQDNGVLIGDKGYFSYSASTASSLQEQRLPIWVAGFYDPGVMSVGNKCILVPKEVTRAINASTTTHYFDKIALNGVQIWLKDLSQVDLIKKQLLLELQDKGVGDYFKVSSYKDYDFSKELLQQFQSDKYLFSLIAIIIITVACCNIISLLVLMVNDKKKEIGILLAMGASPKNIAFIFGTCGIIMGSLGGAIGCLAAYLTLQHIDALVHLLSTLQGHDAFSASFYGKSLPSTISENAIFFVMMLTPMLALIAGLIPAIKACLVKPASILRSES